MTWKAVQRSWVCALPPHHLREREKAEAGCWWFVQITQNGSEPGLDLSPRSKTKQPSSLKQLPWICCLFSDYKCGYHPSLYQVSPGKFTGRRYCGVGFSGVWRRKMTALVFLVWPLFTQKPPLPLFVRLHSRPQSKHRVYFLCKQCYKWKVENICFENSYLSRETKRVHSLSIDFSSSVI